MKTCTKCGETKPLAEFSKDASKRGGLRTKCKGCDSAAASAWYADHPERAKANRSTWRKVNSEKVNAYNVLWNAANPDKANAYNAKWKAAHPEVRRIIKQNRRASERTEGGKLSQGLAAKLFKLQRGKCACGCKQPLGTDYHLDHIMPLARGGANTDDNIQLLRAKCNKQKSAKHPVDFMQQRGFLL